MKREEKDEVLGLIFGMGVNSFNRMHRFMEIQDDLSDRQYWYGLVNAYSASDNTYLIREEIKNLFRSERSERFMMMEEHDFEVFINLSPTITVYRGASVLEFTSGEWGISWTLAQSRAEFFAYEYRRNGATSDHPKVVLKATVSTNDVLAYHSGRSEEEILLHPDAAAKLNPVII